MLLRARKMLEPPPPPPPPGAPSLEASDHKTPDPKPPSLVQAGRLKRLGPLIPSPQSKRSCTCAVGCIIGDDAHVGLCETADGPAPPAIKVLHAIARRPAAVREQEHHVEGRALRFEDEV